MKWNETKKNRAKKLFIRRIKKDIKCSKNNKKRKEHEKGKKWSKLRSLHENWDYVNIHWFERLK